MGFSTATRATSGDGYSLVVVISQEPSRGAFSWPLSHAFRRTAPVERAAAYLREALKRTPTAEKLQKAVDERLELFKPFNLAEAVGTWDAAHRAAVGAWISDPFWT
jgi:hypothetical protein